MTVFYGGQEMAADALPAVRNKTLVAFARMEELPTATAVLGLDADAIDGCREYTSTRYDYADGFDYMLFNLPDFNDLLARAGRVEIYHANDTLLFLDEDLAVTDVLMAELRRQKTDLPTAHVLYRFFSLMVENDAAQLEDMERDISDLEDSMVDKPNPECPTMISTFRKQLMVLKHYYEALYDLLEDLEENSNSLFTKTQLRVLRMQAARVDRLFHTVLNLRDYVTQVRESYQAQMDIMLNQTMKILTVVTTIFMPLTLIVGWYGMNLRMPEVGSAFTYPIVIVASLAIVVASIVYFRKKDWF